MRIVSVELCGLVCEALLVNSLFERTPDGLWHRESCDDDSEKRQESVSKVGSRDGCEKRRTSHRNDKVGLQHSEKSASSSEVERTGKVQRRTA